MIAHAEIFAIAVSLVLAVLLATAGYSLWRAKRMNGGPSLDSFMARLAAVDREKISQIASAYDHADDQEAIEPQASLEDWQIWEMLGGMQGFEALAANCEVLIDLACYVQQWYPEALPVAEQLRLNAREIQWHLDRLKGAESRGNLQAVFPDYAQRAVSVYYGMTQHVLALYEASQIPGWAQLQTAL